MGKKQKIKNEIRTQPCNIHGVVFSEVRAEVCEHNHPKQYNSDIKKWECMGCGEVVEQT